MKITQENYYEDRTHLTQSMAVTFRHSKELYKRRFIENIKKELTPSMKLGSYIDSVLSSEKPLFELTPLQKKDSTGFIDSFMKLPMNHEFNLSKQQQIFTGKLEKILVKGRLDFLLPDKIVDLKISSEAKVKNWYWAVMNMGYDVQAGIYTELVRQNTGKLLPFYHLVGYKENEMYIFKIFKLSSNLVEDGLQEFRRLIKEIKTCKDFSDPLLSWDKAEIIKRVSSDNAYPEEA